MGWMGWMGAGSGTGIGLQRLATSRNVRGPRRIGAARRRRLQGRYPGIGFGAGSIWPTTAAAKQQTWKTHKRWKECIDATLRASCTAQTTGLPFPHPLHHIHPAGCPTGQNIRTEYTSSLLHCVYCARITVFYTDHYYCASAWAAGIERSMGSVREGRGAADGVLRGGCRPVSSTKASHYELPFLLSLPSSVLDQEHGTAASAGTRWDYTTGCRACCPALPPAKGKQAGRWEKSGVE